MNIPPGPHSASCHYLAASAITLNGGSFDPKRVLQDICRVLDSSYFRLRSPVCSLYHISGSLHIATETKSPPSPFKEFLSPTVLLMHSALILPVYNLFYPFHFSPSFLSLLNAHHFLFSLFIFALKSHQSIFPTRGEGEAIFKDMPLLSVENRLQIPQISSFRLSAIILALFLDSTLGLQVSSAVSTSVWQTKGSSRTDRSFLPSLSSEKIPRTTARARNQEVVHRAHAAGSYSASGNIHACIYRHTHIHTRIYTCIYDGMRNCSVAHPEQCGINNIILNYISHVPT